MKPTKLAKLFTASLASFTVCLPLVALSIPLLSPQPAYSDDVGVSQEDLPSYKGAFLIENTTGDPINYQVRWGNKHAWESFTLGSGETMIHSYPLGVDKSAKVPKPYIRFDAFGHTIEYSMEFYAVGYAGYGPSINRTQPKPYFFEYNDSSSQLDLKQR